MRVYKAASDVVFAVVCQCGSESARTDTYLDIPLVVRPFGANIGYGSVVCCLLTYSFTLLSACHAVCRLHFFLLVQDLHIFVNIV